MHEVGLMQETLRIALDHAKKVGAHRIHSITLRVGRLSGAELEPLRLAFEVVAGATMAEQASLRLQEVPVQAWCSGCTSTFQPSDYIFRCPKCGRLSSDVRQGREFELLALEVS
jgi:hydrogenase nickel incorporation protein HypA/HybF